MKTVTTNIDHITTISKDSKYIVERVRVKDVKDTTLRSRTYPGCYVKKWYHKEPKLYLIK